MTDPVERHRDALEALAEHGETPLAEDAAALLGTVKDLED